MGDCYRNKMMPFPPQQNQTSLMLQSTFRTRRRIGSLLVALQFGLMFALAALAAPRVSKGFLPPAALSLAAASLALAAWTLRHNRPGNFNIRPTPMVWGVLVTSGPYRWIRHPMYSSLLLGAGAMALL